MWVKIQSSPQSCLHSLQLAPGTQNHKYTFNASKRCVRISNTRYVASAIVMTFVMTFVELTKIGEKLISLD